MDTPTDDEADYAMRIKRLQAAERLAKRAERGQFDQVVAARQAAKAARKQAASDQQPSACN